jgi:hypothetical protein
MGTSGGIDHIDRKGLNNQRDNLRIDANCHNARNRLPIIGATSKYKGVSWVKRTQGWQAAITTNYHTKHLGYFSTEIEAALAYDAVAEVEHGEYASLNRHFFSELNPRS